MSPSVFLTASRRNAMITVTLSGVLWGLFWIPLRGLEAAGLSGVWATAGFTGVAAAACLIYGLLVRRKQLTAGGRGLLLTGVFTGAAMTLYGNALVFTEVVHAFLLFYLMPVWSMLLARIVLKERITPLRLLSIVMGLVGLITVLGLGEGFPRPRNIGDWMGLLAGLSWSVAAVRLRLQEDIEAEETTIVFLVLAAAFSVLLGFLPHPAVAAMPAPAVWLEALPLLLPISLLFVLPAAYFVIWGTRLLSPGLAGILFMTEVTAGTLSAALFAGEPFGWREGLGVLLITAAGVIGSLAPTESVAGPAAPH